MNGTKFKYLFFTLTFFEVLLQISIWNFHSIQQFTKPMLMPALALFFYNETKEYGHLNKRNAMFVGLFFAWLGDVFLMYTSKGPQYFMYGLGSFLIMQFIYIYIFKTVPIKNIFNLSIPSLLVFLFGAIVLSLILPFLNDLKIPVIVYFLAILIMVLSALSQFYKYKTIPSKEVFIGAALFMISDSAIALNKFYSPLPFEGIIVMVTYIMAQWYIVNGMSKVLKV
jgi:uncharacterized membrane protein YhhN